MHRSAVRPIRSPQVLVGVFDLEEKREHRGHAGLREIFIRVTPLTKESDDAIAYYRLVSVRYCYAPRNSEFWSRMSRKCAGEFHRTVITPRTWFPGEKVFANRCAAS